MGYSGRIGLQAFVGIHFDRCKAQWAGRCWKRLSRFAGVFFVLAIESPSSIANILGDEAY
jgi:hypothetical protein